MKRAKFPQLMQMAHELVALEFQSPLNEDERRCARIKTMNKPSYINYLGGRWQIRAALNGASITLGSLPPGPENAIKAVRFADMARMFFWKYRVRLARKPLPGELNISTARAEADLQSEAAMVALLTKQEAFLLQNHLIGTPEELEIARAAERKKGSKVAQAIEKLTVDLTQKLHDAASVIATQQQRLDALNQQLGDLAIRLAAVQAHQSVEITALQTIADRLLHLSPPAPLSAEAPLTVTCDNPGSSAPGLLCCTSNNGLLGSLPLNK